MNIKVHLMVSLHLLLLATRAQNDPEKASAPTPPWGNDYIPYNKIIPLSVAGLITGVIALLLFKLKIVDSHGLTLAFWTMLLFGSDVLDTWDIRPITMYIIMTHMSVNVLGLAFWMRLGVAYYKKKNARPPADVLFEIGVWIFMVFLSLVEFGLRYALTNRPYFRVYRWYPFAIGFVTMVENFWMRNMEIRVDKLKSEFVNNVEDAFDDFVGACVENFHSDIKIEFDKKSSDFTRMFSVLVAQQRETLIVDR